jgi:hypothetical protein
MNLTMSHPSILLTYSMVQSPSWQANRFAASQEIPRIPQNPKAHYRTHKCSPPVPILGQPKLVRMATSHLLQIHPNIIHPSTPRSPQWSPSLRFPQQDPIHPPLLIHNATCPAHLILQSVHLIPHYSVFSIHLYPLQVQRLICHPSFKGSKDILACHCPQSCFCSICYNRVYQCAINLNIYTY